ncbi:hypothetical protein [Cellvibrio sp. UBA7661]|uniref:hypothetical protein n=1 Tax=Cellvibrio sp. UBA7661 TaxID=1946311 RepID=UPI002F35036C
MKVGIILGIFLSFFSLSSFGEECGYKRLPVYIEIDNSIDLKLSVSIESSDCTQAMVSLRIHGSEKNKNKPLYVVDNKLGAFFGSRAQNPTKTIAQSLADELINEITVKKVAGDFDAGFKCLNLIPKIYLDRLKNKNRNMLSYRWRSNEIRYIAYVEEIEQMVVIAQCSKS